MLLKRLYTFYKMSCYKKLPEWTGTLKRPTVQCTSHLTLAKRSKYPHNIVTWKFKMEDNFDIKDDYTSTTFTSLVCAKSGVSKPNENTTFTTFVRGKTWKLKLAINLKTLVDYVLCNWSDTLWILITIPVHLRRIGIRLTSSRITRRMRSSKRSE